MNTLCQVKNCRYSDSHVTCRHMCGSCHKYGHGILECGNDTMIENLKKSYNDRCSENICCIDDCVDRTTHTTVGHSCLYCNSRNLDSNKFNFKTTDQLNDRQYTEENINYCHLKNCPINGTNIIDNLNDVDIENMLKHTKVSDLKRGYYFLKQAGMGCMWFIRCNIDSGNIEYLFMHSDCWGQYGDDSSDLPRYNAFTHRYMEYK